MIKKNSNAIMTPYKFKPLKYLLPFCLSLCIVSSVSSYSGQDEFKNKSISIMQLKKKYHEMDSKITFAYKKEINRIEKKYYILINSAKKEMPLPAEPKDMFETQYEYNQRIANYNKLYKQAERKKKYQIKQINENFNLRYKTSVVEVKFLKQKIKSLEPIIDKLKTIQGEKHPLRDEIIKINLFKPEADKFRFPIHMFYGNSKLTKYWDYTDRNNAKQFWKFKSYLQAEVLAQFDHPKNGRITIRATSIRVFNTKTKDSRVYEIEAIKPFQEIVAFNKIKFDELPAAELMVALKDIIKGPVSGMNFIFISPRTFTMGSPRNEIGRWANETQHKVKLTKGFYIQTTEVTQGQWREIMGVNPSFYSRCGSDCPVESVYWGEVNDFINRLNILEKTDKYRLPTEAEWEFACRAGSNEMGAYGSDESKLDEYAWYRDNADSLPHPVASKKPNAWGLFDMHGNVSEWCSDWFGPYSNRSVSDPTGPYSGKFRVARGGNWFFPARSCRAADRNANLPGDKSEYIGFRVVKSP